MDLEHLTKTQLVLLGLLISFVTSMATAIFTVSLVNQAPPPITNTINRVVERIVDPMGTNKKEEENKNQQPVFISKEDAIVKVVKDVSPAVVSVIVTDKEKQTKSATGFFVSSDGMIVTNKRVLEDREAQFSIVMSNGRNLEAKVLTKDPFQDLAILKVEGKDFPTVKLGDSDKINVGQTVIAIGDISGKSSNTISIGIIAGLNRKISVQDALLGSGELKTLLQTDAVINDGNSGGPLLNIDGEVVGVNTLVPESTQYVGFATLINFIKRDIQDVKEFGSVQYPYLKIGVEEGDVILEINGVKINQENTLSSIVLKYRVGSKLNVKILRDGKEISVELILEKRPENI